MPIPKQAAVLYSRNPFSNGLLRFRFRTGYVPLPRRATRPFWRGPVSLVDAWSVIEKRGFASKTGQTIEPFVENGPFVA